MFNRYKIRKFCRICLSLLCSILILIFGAYLLFQIRADIQRGQFPDWFTSLNLIVTLLGFYVSLKWIHDAWTAPYTDLIVETPKQERKIIFSWKNFNAASYEIFLLVYVSFYTYPRLIKVTKLISEHKAVSSEMWFKLGLWLVFVCFLLWFIKRQFEKDEYEQ